MSFINYPSALPYFESLHQAELLDNLVSQLGNEQQVDIASLKIKASHPFMDAYDKTANLTLTTNGALTNVSTLDALLDLSYYIHDVTPANRDKRFKASYAQDPLLTLKAIFYTRSIHRGKSLLEAFLNSYSWLLINHPQTAIKNLHLLIDGKVRTDAQLQDLRRKEKKNAKAVEEGWDVLSDTEEELFIRRDFKSHGCWKDLNTLLTVYCQGELEGIKNYPAPDRRQYVMVGCPTYAALQWPRDGRSKKVRRIARREQTIRYNLRLAMTEEDAKKNVEECHALHFKNNALKQEEAKKKRHETRIQRNKTVSDLLENDQTYRALHFTVARLYADQLKVDMEQLNKNRNDRKKGKYALGFNLSLAAKWAPTLGHSHDKHTFLATSISEVLYPPQLHQEKDESRVHYLNKVRELYRKEYLVPLRKALDITEHYKADGKWDKVDIRHMPSVCLDQNMSLFFKHSPDTVIDYMKDVAEGNKKVSGATLAPNELVHQACEGGIKPRLRRVVDSVPGLAEKFLTAQSNMVNGQWDTLLGSIRDTALLSCDKKDPSKKKVDLGECIAICDVSGSMLCGGLKPEMAPYYAAIGLSLIVTNLAKPPFNGAIITFTNEPDILKVDTSLPFSEQVKVLTDSPAGYNTDLCKVFTEVLLPMAKKHNLAPEDMVKRLFIFTDMQFDDAPNGMDELMTTQDFIRKQYKDAGYEMPELVWWNMCSSDQFLQHAQNTPITKDDAGVSLLSGYSASMIKTFLDGDVEEEERGPAEEQKEREPLTSVDALKKAINHESFDGLVVYD
ncbi:hypothetical protein INT47_001469 [Mucor saturninus]|uniref:VWFA domain-containing protein n=1 Tax=Mucor saturninus TaxID=64648 RepID=A0A8H7R0S2_9FUNG|nr:hypothetical protein INT47_001469 [Mucor saturninus]